MKDTLLTANKIELKKHIVSSGDIKNCTVYAENPEKAFIEAYRRVEPNAVGVIAEVKVSENEDDDMFFLTENVLQKAGIRVYKKN